MNKKGGILALVLLLVPVCLSAQKRGLANMDAVYIEKGTRSVGLSMGWNSWNTEGSEGVDLLGIVSGLRGSVNIFDVSAVGAWFVKDNMSVGLSVGYSDARLDIDSTEFLGNETRDRHIMRGALKGSATCRRYLPIFGGKVAAMFVEGRLTGQTGYAKNYNRTTNGKEGTYTNLGSVALGLYPGISLFATDRISFEVSMPLFEGGCAWNDESSTNRADASLNHGFVRFKPALTGIKMGIMYHF